MSFESVKSPYLAFSSSPSLIWEVEVKKPTICNLLVGLEQRAGLRETTNEQEKGDEE